AHSFRLDEFYPLAISNLQKDTSNSFPLPKFQIFFQKSLDNLSRFIKRTIAATKILPSSFSSTRRVLSIGYLQFTKRACHCFLRTIFIIIFQKSLDNLSRFIKRTIAATKIL